MDASVPRGARPLPPPLVERRRGPVVLRLWPATHPTADVEVVTAIFGALLWAALLALPLERLAPLAGECRFRSWTGHPCLTCGATRAVLALAHGDVGGALAMNPLVGALLVALLAAAAPAALAWALRWPRPRLAPAGTGARRALVALVVAALAANWIYLLAVGR